MESSPGAASEEASEVAERTADTFGERYGGAWLDWDAAGKRLVTVGVVNIKDDDIKWAKEQSSSLVSVILIPVKYAQKTLDEFQDVASDISFESGDCISVGSHDVHNRVEVGPRNRENHAIPHRGKLRPCYLSTSPVDLPDVESWDLALPILDPSTTAVAKE